MDTDTHGCGLPASSRSTGRRLEQNCMVMFWRNAILVSLDLVHQIAQRLSFGKARYVVDHQVVIAGAHAVGHGGDVRRDDHVLEFPESVALWERLRIRNVRSRAVVSPRV